MNLSIIPFPVVTTGRPANENPGPQNFCPRTTFGAERPRVHSRPVMLCGVDQCLVEAKARSSAAAFDSPVVRAQFAKRRRTLDTTAKSDGIVANHPQAGSERESGTRPGVAGTVAGTRQPDPANRRSDTDLFASESGTDGALSEAFQAG